MHMYFGASVRAKTRALYFFNLLAPKIHLLCVKTHHLIRFFEHFCRLSMDNKFYIFPTSVNG